ncbi:MAG: Rpn family recombination-promoting nuclease/putative transposase [Enterobacteriaceae bacterium]|nr:Rpn family recombination-promoting nuclease/putative transposase [Enterobacteriaceae bacterium]
MAETTTPHDAVFKTFLSRVETARDFIKIHLPPALLNLCDLNTLRLEPGSFVEDDLRQYYSDILYSLKTTCGEGYIHVLIEHQSSPDRHMAFRLMRYAIAVMQRHLEAGHTLLPLVIPILFYQGERTPYPYSMNWLDDFHDPQRARQLYDNAFPLVDITIIPDEQIMHHRSMAALTLVQKHIRQRDMARLLDQLAALLMMEQMSRQQIVGLVNYMIRAGDAQSIEPLLYELAQRVPKHGETLMTMAEELLQRGIQKGKFNALLEIAQKMLQRGFDSQAIMEITGLSKDELQQLEQ